ncbi:hypothetical protein ZWY2020_000361 [Hordeum vulgare]|nr:hypothetical protein ZWY2020_000361 [Hordeum vulgare]
MEHAVLRRQAAQPRFPRRPLRAARRIARQRDRPGEVIVGQIRGVGRHDVRPAGRGVPVRAVGRRWEPSLRPPKSTRIRPGSSCYGSRPPASRAAGGARQRVVVSEPSTASPGAPEGAARSQPAARLSEG